jgi:uncharacterized protein
LRLDDDMKRLVREQRLGFVATVCADGTPNLSPKGTTSIWDDEHLVFLHLHSPKTVANLAANPAVEVNVVDPIVRKGYRFKGKGQVVADGPLFDEVVRFYRVERDTDPARVHAAVLIRVETAEPLISPVYDAGVSEAEVVSRWRRHHLELTSALSNDATSSAAPDQAHPELVCDLGELDPSQRRRHRQLGTRLAPMRSGITALPDGYRVLFPTEPPLGAELAEWATLERLCCPFLHFALHMTPSDLWLDMSGGPGVKEFLLAEFPWLTEAQ